MIRSASPSIYVSGRMRPGWEVRPRRADPPWAFGRRRLAGSISPAAVSAIASAIQTQEGYYPGSLAYTNNNPGNLRYVGQTGAGQGTGAFASFPTYQAGLAALQAQITLDATRGTDASGNPTTTISQLISSWAPSTENNTSAYIASVASQTGYDPNAPLSSLGDPASSSPIDVSSIATWPDLSGVTSSTVDLSSVGLGSSVPTYALVGGGLLALLVLSSL